MESLSIPCYQLARKGKCIKLLCSLFGVFAGKFLPRLFPPIQGLITLLYTANPVPLYPGINYITLYTTNPVPLYPGINYITLYSEPCSCAGFAGHIHIIPCHREREAVIKSKEYESNSSEEKGSCCCLGDVLTI